MKIRLVELRGRVIHRCPSEIREELKIVQSGPNSGGFLWNISDPQTDLGIEFEEIGPPGNQYLSICFLAPIAGDFEYEGNEEGIVRFVESIMDRTVMFRVYSLPWKIIMWVPDVYEPKLPYFERLLHFAPFVRSECLTLDELSDIVNKTSSS